MARKDAARAMREKRSNGLMIIVLPIVCGSRRNVAIQARITDYIHAAMMAPAKKFDHAPKSDPDLMCAVLWL
jgi:hypothetical protein